MSPSQADRIIKAGRQARFRDDFYGETFVATLASRDRWNVTTTNGAIMDRGDLTFEHYLPRPPLGQG